LQHEHIQISNGFVPDTTVSLVTDAIYAFAYAISDHINKTEDLYDAEGNVQIPPWKLIEYIRKITFPGSAQRTSVSLGNPTARYDISNLQVTSDGR